MLKLLFAFVKLFDSAPAAFGRLCVETNNDDFYLMNTTPSRLRAAVC